MVKYHKKPVKILHSRFMRVRNFMDKNVLESILIEKQDKSRNRHLKQLLTRIYEELGLVDWRVGQLKSLNSGKRKIAAYNLGSSLSKKAVKPLTEISLHDSNEDVRFVALKSLGKLEATDSLEKIIGLFKSFSYERCMVVADILIDFHYKALPLLCKYLNSPDSNTRFWCLRTLVEIDITVHLPFYEEMKSKIITLLNDQYYETRAFAAVCLAKLGEKNSSAKILKLLQNDQHPLVRSYAAGALGMLNTDSIIVGLVEAMKDKSWEVSYNASLALVNFGAEKVESALKIDPTCSFAEAWVRCKELAGGELDINDLE